MKSFISALLLLIITCRCLSQECDCKSEFRFVKEHFEKNHGGFNKKIKSPDEPRYKKFTDGLEKSIGEMKDPRDCIIYLKKYILFLQDHHSNITAASGTPVKEDSAAAVEAFLQSPVYRNTETIPVDSIAILDHFKKTTDPLEGIYQTPDGTYRVAVLKNKTARRDYVSVILTSKTPLWTKGQIKFELKQVNDSLMDYFIYLRNHSLSFDEVSFKKSAPTINGWIKQTGTVSASLPVVIDKDIIRFTVLDEQTTLLSIRSFSSSIFKTLDSVYKKVVPEIKKYPNLIIDVRNNGGGADFSYAGLMPLLYTDTIFSDVVEIYNTPGNMEAYQKFNEAASKNGSSPVFKRSLSLMEKAKPYSFVPMGSGKPSTAVYAVNTGYPAKIAIVYNRGCASSCESLLFDARYSKKTMLVGENSGGFTGYGDVMTMQTPCGNSLSWTTTVYRDQWKYEFVGIPPQYRIPESERDWIEYTRKMMEK